jgi:hypothetical protein
MIPNYELIESLQMIQKKISPSIEISAEFNELTLKKLTSDQKTNVERAVNIVLNQEDFSREEAIQALIELAKFSKKAVEVQFVDEITNIWLTDNELDSGIDSNGKIVFWPKGYPNQKISIKLVLDA